MSILRRDDEKYHYSDGSHRWVPPDPELDREVWEEQVRQRAARQSRSIRGRTVSGSSPTVVSVSAMRPALPRHPSRMDPPPRTPPVGWIIAGAIVLGCLLGLVLPVAGFLLWLFGGPDLDEPRAAADRFVRHLESNDDEAAYRSLCPGIRERTTAANLSTAVERIGRPVSHTVGRAAFLDEAGTSAGVTVRLTDRAGRTTTVDLYVDSEFGWQVCDDAFG